MNKEKFYPILPLRDIVVYPNIIVPLFVGRAKSIAALDAAMDADQELLLVPQLDVKTVDPEVNEIHKIGSLGRIIQIAKLSDGTVKALVEGIERVSINPVKGDDYLKGTKSAILESCSLSHVEEQSSIDVAIEGFTEYLKARERNPDELIDTIKNLDHCGKVADTIAAHMDLTIEERIKLLDLTDTGERINQILIYLENAKEKTELDIVIKNRVKQQMEKNQREYYLNEKIKAIQKELGDMDEALNEIEQLEEQIHSAKMSKEAETKSLTELNKLKQMSPMSAEANVIRSYLEWMIAFPWSKKRKTQYNLSRAEKILNRDHYGLQDVKERILEYLAVQKRNKEGKGPIICLVGPPGVGKTSLGKSIAEATGRDFDRIALGGMHDEAEIRGHRKTYIGALPGKIVQKLSKLGSNNPLILLDEIDKIGTDHRGDPASALLEVLDPSQNSIFNDHYLEVGVDLSKVLFIATANTLNIPAPLLDRMEVIRLPGYTTKEKIQIASEYIVPRQREEHALKGSELKFDSQVYEKIIEDYTREAGVRNLEREIARIARKSVRKLEEKELKSIMVTPKNVTQFLGVEKFQRVEESLNAKVGSVTGLAWTSVGGELLQIETVAFAGKGKLVCTGQMGDVMQESVQAALSVVRAYLDEHDPHFKFFDYDLHMHLPEGATPKDGPSAGIGMATALFSALTKKAVYGDIAMTGEITLHGKVLPIGGLKEKLIAAQRGHLNKVLIPKDNVKDLEEIPEDVKKDLNIVAVETIDEVFSHAFQGETGKFTANIFSRPFQSKQDLTTNSSTNHC